MTTPHQSPCDPQDTKSTPIQEVIGLEEEWHFFTRMVYLSIQQQTMTTQIWNTLISLFLPWTQCIFVLWLSADQCAEIWRGFSRLHGEEH